MVIYQKYGDPHELPVSENCNEYIKLIEIWTI